MRITHAAQGWVKKGVLAQVPVKSSVCYYSVLTWVCVVGSRYLMGLVFVRDRPFDARPVLTICQPSRLAILSGVLWLLGKHAVEVGRRAGRRNPPKAHGLLLGSNLWTLSWNCESSFLSDLMVMLPKN